MPEYFCLSFTFLDRRFHGRGEDREPQWPPSPLRAVQALVAAAAAHWNERTRLVHAAPALKWLESRPAPLIIAPNARPSTSGHLLSVPNNSLDVTARAWSRGNPNPGGEADPRKHRTMKGVWPTHMIDGDTVHFLWELPGDPSADESAHLETLQIAARSIVALGWGVDLVSASARIIADDAVDGLAGERWHPCGMPTATALQVAKAGTLDALCRRHTEFLTRLQGDHLTPPMPLSSMRFDLTFYRRNDEPLAQPIAAFKLLHIEDANRFQSYDAVRHTHLVAAMMRATTSRQAGADRWEQAQIDSFVLGHGPGQGEPARGVPRFAYLPISSLEARQGTAGVRHVGPIRRLMVAVFPEPMPAHTNWAARRLAGEILTPLPNETRITGALLQPLSPADAAIRRFATAAETWATVTPVLLPGTGRRNPTDMEQLIRRAIRDAGFANELADFAEIRWRPTGFFPGVQLATRYARPRHLARYCATHIEIRWRYRHGNPIRVSGPICLGVGRFYGLGLFAHSND